MKIVNAMFGLGQGGIEQAFLDYAGALKKSGHSVINLVQPNAKITEDLWQVTNRIHQVSNFGWWDFFAAGRIRKILLSFNPDVIITHGNRAFTLMNKASGGRAKMVAVVHNYKYKKLLKADYFFSITEHLRKSLIKSGVAEAKIYKIPNMIKVESTQYKFNGWNKPVIGVLGRLVRKKGFHDFIDALAILKNKGIDFSAIIAGGGEEEELLKNMANNHGLDINFPGWITDKKSFFAGLDIFCLPSIHEPFGIVLLEAMLYGKPIITSDSEGPSEIIREEENGLFFPRGNAAALASTLERLIKNQRLAEWISDGAYKTVRLEYDADIIGTKISDALVEIANG